MRWSVDRDVGVLDDLGPTSSFAAHEAAHLLRAVTDDLSALFSESLLYVGLVECFNQRTVERFHRSRRSTGRGNNCEPSHRLHTCQTNFSKRRYILKEGLNKS